MYLNFYVSLDFVEFITAYTIISKGTIQEKLHLAFSIYDFNRDGVIERKEAEKIVYVCTKVL